MPPDSVPRRPPPKPQAGSRSLAAVTAIAHRASDQGSSIAAAPEPEPEPEPNAAPARSRSQSRGATCKDCGQHLQYDEVDSHVCWASGRGGAALGPPPRGPSPSPAAPGDTVKPLPQWFAASIASASAGLGLSAAKDAPPLRWAPARARALPAARWRRPGRRRGGRWP